MKRKFILILVACFALMLSACSATSAASLARTLKETAASASEAAEESAPEAAEEPEPEAAEESAPEAAEEPAPDYDAQIALILENQSLWDQTAKEDSEYNRYSYAVTDLDGNGRLEIFAAITQGSGIFTTAYALEVSEGLDSLVQLSLPDEDGVVPELIVSSVQKFADSESGVNYYIVYDSSKAGFSYSSESTNALSLKDGTITVSTLGYVLSSYTSNGSSVTEDTHYYGADDTEITESEYLSLAADKFAGYAESTQSFGWFTLNDGSAADLLPLSWQVFSGEVAAIDESLSASDSTLANVQTEAYNQYADQAITITKDLEELTGAVAAGRYNQMFIINAKGNLDTYTSFDWQKFDDATQSWVSIEFTGTATTNEDYGLRIENSYDSSTGEYETILWANGITPAAAGTYRCVITDTSGITKTSSESIVSVTTG